MSEKNYKVTLSDGTVIDNLKLNGNNFISNEIIDPMLFNGNCSPVVISEGINEEIHDNMEVVQITQVNGDYWFVLRDIAISELKQLKLQSDIEYVAMMTGIEL